MLPAKLFAGLALAFSIFTGLAWVFVSPSADVTAPHLATGRGAFFAFEPVLVPLFCAVTSLNFAVLYYAGGRILHAQWNRTLSLLHFALSVCGAASGSIVFPMAAHYGNGSNAGETALRWVFIPLLLGILSFVASYVIFAISLMSVVIQVVRARFATR
ncbi:MAG TPA: hypothetical protein VJW94_09550 [Candidatus Acidoferrum sp.]|nr:hypothetical protein [Candidatus Acidoferrum sp.]